MSDDGNMLVYTMATIVTPSAIVSNSAFFAQELRCSNAQKFCPSMQAQRKRQKPSRCKNSSLTHQNYSYRVYFSAQQPLSAPVNARAQQHSDNEQNNDQRRHLASERREIQRRRRNSVQGAETQRRQDGWHAKMLDAAEEWSYNG